MFPSLLGRTFVWFVNGCVTGLVAFPILALAFGLHVPAMSWAAFAPIVLLTCFSTYAFSLALGVLVAKVPGFRPGKIPGNVVRTRFAKEIQEEVVSRVLGQSFREAVTGKGLR